MSRDLPPDDGPRPEPPRPPQPYAPPRSGPYAPPAQHGPYAAPPPGGPHAPPPQYGPYTPAQGGPHQPYGPPPGGPHHAPPPGQPGPRHGAPPPPYGQGRPAAPDGPTTEVAPAPRTAGPRPRRTTEIIALAILLPLLLGLHWYDDSTTTRDGIERPEAVTVVTAGKPGTLNRVQWTMLGRDVSDTSATPRSTPASGKTELKLLVAVRPLDAQAGKDLSHGRLVFRVRDREGHIWSATADLSAGAPPGTVTQVPVLAFVPPGKVTSVVLEIAQSRIYVQKGSVGVLRFAH